MSGVCVLLVYLLLHAADQTSDVLTALIYFAQGFLLEGCCTLLLVYIPGLVVFFIETKEALLGRTNICRGFLYMIVCPVYTWVIILYSIHHREWRDKAMFLVVLEGLLTGSPQLVLQLSLWFKGVLTRPALTLLDHIPSVLHEDFSSSPNITGDTTRTFQFLGREYESDISWIFGIVQLCSILISFLSVLGSGIYYNEVENSFSSAGSTYRKCLGIPFFINTILFRATALALVICFLKWWSSLIIFLLFFLTVLVSVCAGDRFFRGCLYGLWSILLPLGYSRDPLESLGYKVYRQYTTAETNDYLSKGLLKQRAKYFLTTHLSISAVLLLPAVIITTVLVNQAQVDHWLNINTEFIFKYTWLNLAIVPGTGVLLAVSVLLGRCYLSRVYTDLKYTQGN